MRIKSGGSNRSQRAQGAKGAKGADKAKGAKFAGLVENTEMDTEERARQVRSALLEELLEIAQDVEDGTTSKEEASRKFAGLVIKERFGNPEKSKGGKKMVDTIGDMVENDPNFVSRLSSQLKKLSKS